MVQILSALALFLAINSFNIDASPVNIPASKLPRLIVRIHRNASYDDTVANVRASFFEPLTPEAPAQREWQSERFSINWYSAVAIPGDSDLARQILDQNIPGVAAVEKEIQYATFGVELNAAVGLDRIDTKQGALDGKFEFRDNDGEDVDVFVIDTGVDVNHPDFQGRAIIQDFTGEGNRDGNGHGTHVAGIVASATFGVAKKANIIGLKTLSSTGTGSNLLVLRALQAVAQQAQRSNRKSVVNMSLGGPKSGSDTNMLRAIQALLGLGVPVVVAAGNEAQDSCNVSPAFIPEAITVAASDQRDQFASFSDFGSCTDIIAPGVQIRSLRANTVGSILLSGTSMSSPHVAGVVAALLSRGIAPAQIRSTLLETATPDVIGGNLRGTPNRLLFLDPTTTAIASSTNASSVVSTPTPVPVATPIRGRTNTSNRGRHPVVIPRNRQNQNTPRNRRSG